MRQNTSFGFGISKEEAAKPLMLNLNFLDVDSTLIIVLIIAAII
ncbi:MAG: hypothetical protein ACI8RD_013628 [Bacillariaceae sp.]|jgi:hypothetical protein